MEVFVKNIVAANQLVRQPPCNRPYERAVGSYFGSKLLLESLCVGVHHCRLTTILIPCTPRSVTGSRSVKETDRANRWGLYCCIRHPMSDTTMSTKSQADYDSLQSPSTSTCVVQPPRIILLQPEPRPYAQLFIRQGEAGQRQVFAALIRGSKHVSNDLASPGIWSTKETPKTPDNKTGSEDWAKSGWKAMKDEGLSDSDSATECGSSPLYGSIVSVSSGAGGEHNRASGMPANFTETYGSERQDPLDVSSGDWQWSEDLLVDANWGVLVPADIWLLGDQDGVQTGILDTIPSQEAAACGCLVRSLVRAPSRSSNRAHARKRNWAARPKALSVRYTNLTSK
jgi:hypothetical protein